MGTGFFKAATQPEREPSRPRFVNPKTGIEQSWQRASNFAAPLESPFGMIKHKTRQVVRGLNRRLDLARMLLTGAVIEDKVDEVIETALTAAEDEAKANNGTAVHAALGLCDMGREVPAEYIPHAQNYVAELKRHNLRPVAVEVRILNTHLGATGTFDRLYVTDSGRYLIGDIKTGSLSHPHGYAVQCEVYSGADYIVHVDGTIEPIPWTIDQTAALIVHVDPDTGATSVYEVPLHLARWGAALAEQVRAFQRTDILLPYSGAPAGPLAAELQREAARSADGKIVASDAAGVALIQGAEGFNADIAAEVQASVAEVSTNQAAPAGSPTAATASPSDGPLTAQEIEAARKHKIDTSDAAYVRRMLELLKPKNNKAALQRMLSDLGGRDLAHNRKWLAEKIIEMESGSAATAQHVAQTIEADVPAAEATPFTLKQISEAATVEDLGRIRDHIIAQSGDGAWSPAMQEVAQARYNELIGPRIDQAPLPDGSPLTRIADAKSTQDLALVWESVTSGGANVAAWTPAYDKAAKERAAVLAAAQPQNINPWGSQ